VRPHIKEINNGGKLFINLDKEVEFPDDMVEQLNANKDTYVLMQLIPEGESPEPLPTIMPIAPVDNAA